MILYGLCITTMILVIAVAHLKQVKCSRKQAR